MPAGAVRGTMAGMRAGAELSDDVLVQPAWARSPRLWFRDAVDRLVGADPGLNQLRMAVQATLSIGIGLGLAYLFVRLTGALQLPAGSGPAPVRSAADHALLLVSMLLAGMVAMQASFVVQERTMTWQLLSSVFLPVPMVAMLVIGLLIGRYRVPSLVVMVLALTGAVYLRRFGPRGLGAGNAVFFGAFLGFFLHAQLGLRDAGWIFADLEVGVLASLLVRFALFRPDPEGSLARMRRSQRARARRLLALAIDILGATDPARVQALNERIRRQLVRLNETVLMIDAQLADAHPDTAPVEAQRSFEAELAVTNCARFAAALAGKDAPAEVRRRAAAALTALLGTVPRRADAHDPPVPHAVADAVAALRAAPSANEREALLISRLAASIEQYAPARARVEGPVSEAEMAAATGDFTPAAELVNNWLPGSAPVSTEASTTPARGLLDRATMPPYLRTTIQIAVAGTLAVVIGDAVSAGRLYWAVLTVFVSFLMATNTGEQLRRALLRAGGTAVGIVVGALLVHVTGGRVAASVLIVLAAMFIGVYLIRVNYMFLTIGITVMIAQLYVQLGEFSWQILLLRLAETAVGVGAVVVTVLVIVPLRPRRVLTTGVLLWFRTVRELLEAVLDRIDGPRPPLRPLVRALDAAYASLVTAATPLRRVVFGRTSTQVIQVLAVASAVRQYARSLAAGIEEAEAAGDEFPSADAGPLRGAADQLRASLEAIEQRLAAGGRDPYVRSAALLALVLDDLRRDGSPLADAVQDLTLLDGALARLAGALRMEVDDHDTAVVTGAGSK
jgi:uncharacterized membrane protein YgaE (UPF0421/DUF939 family)